MRFKATLVDIGCIVLLSKIVNTVAKLSKRCAIKFTENKIFFILTENQLNGGTSLWSELSQVNFCSGYEFRGHSDENIIVMEVAVDIFNHALKSAQQAKVLRIKLTQKKTACLTLEIVLPSQTNRVITHDIPIALVPSKQWCEYREPIIPDFEVSLYLPPIRVIKNVIERLKNIGAALCVSANRNGELLFKVKSELSTVSVSFKDLPDANWSDEGPSQSQAVVRESDKTRFYSVTIDNKKLHQFLSGLQLSTEKIVCSEL